MTPPDGFEIPPLEVRYRALQGLVTRLIEENQQLRQRVEELERERQGLPLEHVVTAVARGAQLAQEGMASEPGERLAYTIAELSTTLRGLVLVRDEGLVLSLPSAQWPLDPRLLGNVAVTLTNVPMSPLTPAARDLVRALEQIQAAFSGWRRDAGAEEAADVTARLTRLLGEPKIWSGPEFGTSMQELAVSVGSLTKAVTGQVPARPLAAYRAAAKALGALAVALPSAPAAEDLEQLAAAVAQLGAAVARL